MKNLIRLELRRFSLKPHLIGLLVANLIILLLSVFSSTLLMTGQEVSISAGLPAMQLNTVTLAVMLIRATMIVWEAIIISSLIIEEYRSKTMSLLFTYPVNRAKLIMAKVIIVCGLSLVFQIASNVFQHFGVFLLSRQLEFVTFSFESIPIQILTIIATILIGLLPLCVGMVKKSTIATIVSSIIIVVVASNSQGNSAGLMSLPVTAIAFGLTGLIFSVVTIRKMITSDLNN
jgi:ABC-type transport system involved in multi-copper enzyme maturation permease subunit